MLPDYLSKASPNPASNRAPWYANTAPTYAGIFLWIAFYKQIAEGTLTQASLAICLAALVLAGILCYALFYRVPATLGMKTGYPLYVVGSSTFGTKGGYLMPGLLMGLLQIGWFAVATFVAADAGKAVTRSPTAAMTVTTTALDSRRSRPGVSRGIRRSSLRVPSSRDALIGRVEVVQGRRRRRAGNGRSRGAAPRRARARGGVLRSPRPVSGTRRGRLRGPRGRARRGAHDEPQ